MTQPGFKPATATTLPSFFLIGAAKAGTTAFFELLGRQRGIYVPTIKEPNYFALGNQPPTFRGPGDSEGINRRSIWERDDYEKLFMDAAPWQAAGEASIIYLSSSRAASAIRRELPHARFIVILRDPVDRALSAFRHLRRDGREEFEDFRDALAAESHRIADRWEPLWHYERLGRYFDHLQAWFDVFQRDQFLVVRYERFRVDPHSVLTAACRFLSVEPGNTPRRDQRVNESGIPRSPRLQRLLVGDSKPKRLLRPVVPARLRQQVWRFLMRHNTRPTAPEIPDKLEADLRAHYLSQVEGLEQLLDWDLSDWKSSS